MGILIVGANGATGVNLVKQILKNGRQVKVIVRPSSKIPNTWNKNNQVSVIRRNINEISLEELILQNREVLDLKVKKGQKLTIIKESN